MERKKKKMHYNIFISSKFLNIIFNFFTKWNNLESFKEKFNIKFEIKCFSTNWYIFNSRVYYSDESRIGKSPCGRVTNRIFR